MNIWICVIGLLLLSLSLYQTYEGKQLFVAQQNPNLNQEMFSDDTSSVNQVIAKDAFPCSSNSDLEKKGCYYQDLGGCVETLYPLQQCPATSQEFLKGTNSNSGVLPANESIFEYIYDALKNQVRDENCQQNKQCPIEFFKKISVMTDGELDAYINRIKSHPCDEGAICLLPENVAEYISESQQNIDCSKKSQLRDQNKNVFSQQLYDRVYNICT